MGQRGAQRRRRRVVGEEHQEVHNTVVEMVCRSPTALAISHRHSTPPPQGRWQGGPCVDLHRQGPSGLLQVVGSLYLWRKAFKDANPSKEYREAIEDFTWLLKEINGQLQLEAGTLVAKAASS